ncbi:DNA repair -like protein 1, mitochondrial [Sesamum angolense]|uniref:DNA repair -like protein 1, mitochondrial n=1 Tax=Sesamum angolense TaxID=2727404 RepID=A0AAE1WDK4_9LAMI|nr:DNA repair -like protein 1, mitochondrial [Sesamum angolense]
MAGSSSLSKFAKSYCSRLHRRRFSAKPFSPSSSSSSSPLNTSNSTKLQQETNLGLEDEVPVSGISRPLSHILKELNKKVPESLLRLRTEPTGVSIKYIPWHIVNRIMNLHAPEWSGEVRSITYSADGKSVSVVYRVTLYGTDAEIFRESTGTSSEPGTGILCRRQKRWHFVELVLALGLDCIFIMKTWNSAVVSWPCGNYAWDDRRRRRIIKDDEHRCRTVRGHNLHKGICCGLAWETQKDTMKKYFEQFGEILEAVVITDKTTGRSKGYGFVTFREPDAAMRACVDATPVIDGRRANCNLASLGVQRSKPSTPKHGAGGGTGGRNIRVVGGGGGFHQGAGAGAGAGAGGFQGFASTFPHYSIQQGIPYNLYAGYSPYSPEYAYPTSYYGVYGGGSPQYPLYGTGSTGGLLSGAAAAAAAYYPYLNLSSEGTGGAAAYSASQGYAGGVQYPHHLFQYSAINSTAIYPPHYGTPVSLAPPTPLQSGVTMTLHAPIPIPHR